MENHPHSIINTLLIFIFIINDVHKTKLTYQLTDISTVDMDKP